MLNSSPLAMPSTSPHTKLVWRKVMSALTKRHLRVSSAAVILRDAALVMRKVTSVLTKRHLVGLANLDSPSIFN